jgi:hypothetical protein
MPLNASEAMVLTTWGVTTDRQNEAVVHRRGIQRARPARLPHFAAMSSNYTKRIPAAGRRGEDSRRALGRSGIAGAGSKRAAKTA